MKWSKIETDALGFLGWFQCTEKIFSVRRTDKGILLHNQSGTWRDWLPLSQSDFQLETLRVTSWYFRNVLQPKGHTESETGGWGEKGWTGQGQSTGSSQGSSYQNQGSSYQGSNQKKEAPKQAPRPTGDYAVLHLLPSAPWQVVQAAYKAMARIEHPDMGGSHERMIEVNEAYAKIAKLTGN